MGRHNKGTAREKEMDCEKPYTYIDLQNKCCNFINANNSITKAENHHEFEIIE